MATQTVLARHPDSANHDLPVAIWRVMEGYELDGAYNMAVDEALLESVIRGGQPAVRFYTWSPPTLSLGVNQSVGEIDAVACGERGFGLVRRITGGRAVLHQHELTYSVVAPENDPRVSGGVLESYRKISVALVEGLRSLGVDVELSLYNRELIASLRRRTIVRDSLIDGRQETASVHGAVCFDAASAYEITANGKKLVGSAQARRGGAILQHGSILLDVDWEAWASVFSYASGAGRERALRKLPTRMTSLKQELGRDTSPAEVAGALKVAFERALEVSLEAGGLADEESAVAERLAREKYMVREWTVRT
jgi:lipoate-protein ligase A